MDRGKTGRLVETAVELGYPGPMLRTVRNAIGKFPVVHRAIRRVWTPPESVYQHLHFEGVFTVEVAPGASFRIEAHGEQVENDLFWRGFGKGWESKSLQLWRELVPSADFIADVGANTGVYALAAQALKPTAKVLAVEPSARVFDKLQRNIALNGLPIIAVDCAVSDRSGQATFYDCADPHQYSASLEHGMGGDVEVIVAVERLDDLLPKNGFERLDLMKLDVELHEPAALRGLRVPSSDAGQRCWSKSSGPGSRPSFVRCSSRLATASSASMR